jgi:hypothetical protein
MACDVISRCSSVSEDGSWVRVIDFLRGVIGFLCGMLGVWLPLGRLRAPSIGVAGRVRVRRSGEGVGGEWTSSGVVGVPLDFWVSTFFWDFVSSGLSGARRLLWERVTAGEKGAGAFCWSSHICLGWSSHFCLRDLHSVLERVLFAHNSLIHAVQAWASSIVLILKLWVGRSPLPQEKSEHAGHVGNARASLA